MGFLSGLFHSRDKPTNSTNGSAYRFLFGGSNSGKAVNERSAMQMTAVYACVRILSESIAGLPVHVYKYTDSGSKEKAINHPLYRLIHDEPNPEMTSFVFRETLMTHLLLYGNAYAQIIRNGKGEVIALYPLMANRMSVDRDDKGHLYYQYQMQDSDAPTMKNGTVILKPSDVLHVPGLGFDGLVGYSPIAMVKNAIATEEYGAKFFANGATPGGILEYPGTVKNPEAVRESWTKGFSGNNSHKVAVLEEGMKYTPISISPNEAQFLETRKFQIDEIARIFRVPPHVETVVLLSHKKPDGHINVKVEFGEGEGKVPLDNIAKRAEEYKPKERVTYKMIKEYIEAKYGFKVHTAYIAEVKRDLGLPMYDAPNAVEELKHPRKHPTPEKVEAIKDALKHFEVI